MKQVGLHFSQNRFSAFALNRPRLKWPLLQKKSHATNIGAALTIPTSITFEFPPTATSAALPVRSINHKLKGSAARALRIALVLGTVALLSIAGINRIANGPVRHYAVVTPLAVNLDVVLADASVDFDANRIVQNEGSQAYYGEFTRKQADRIRSNRAVTYVMLDSAAEGRRSTFDRAISNIDLSVPSIDLNKIGLPDSVTGWTSNLR